VTTSLGSAWLRRFHPAPAAVARLVCFPHAGGAAPYFFPWSAALSPRLEVLAVQYPGRQERRHEPLVDSIDALADAVAAELRELTGLPLLLFGHSMGATVAYEVARRLTPAHLFVSGRRAPSRPWAQRMHTRPDAEILAELGKLSGTDAKVLGSEEIMRLALPALRNDYRAVETYRDPGGPRVGCPISVLIGDDDPTSSVPDATAWRDHTTGPCAVHVFGCVRRTEGRLGCVERTEGHIGALDAQTLGVT
jgi:pyochelin biosynthetic protein PchC